MDRLCRLLCFSALLLLGAGCGNSPSGHGWTVLVYMVADNNLEPFAMANLQEMGAVGNSSQMHLVVQVDRASGFSDVSLPGVGVWSGARRLEVQSDHFQVVDNIGNLDMGDPATLSDFIQWGMRKYPADQYALVLWDHGGAWSGFGLDESHNGDLLTLGKLKQGLATGLGSGKTFAVIGFDACLMGTYEVAQAVAPYAHYLLASEEMEPGIGWDYKSFSALLKNPKLDAQSLGKAIADGFVAQSNAYQKEADITLALTDLSALGDISKALDTLSAAGTAAAANASPDIGRARASALKFSDFSDPAASMSMVDLGNLATKLAGANASFQPGLNQLSTALSKAVVYKVSGSVTQNSTGLSVYFPPQVGAFDGTDYAALTGVTSWSSFLTTYFNPTSIAGPTFTGHSFMPSVTTLLFQLTGTLSPGTAAKVVTTTFLYGLQLQDGTVDLFGRGPGEVDANANTATGQWNLRAATLQQGGLTAYGYLQQQVSATGSFSNAIPFAYQSSPTAAKQEVVRQVSWDAGGNITSDTYYLVNPLVNPGTSGNGYGELSSVPGSTLTPLIQTIDGTGKVSWQLSSSASFSASDLAHNPIQLSFSKLQAGRTAFGVLLVQDASGRTNRTDYATGAGPVPGP